MATGKKRASGVPDPPEITLPREAASSSPDQDADLVESEVHLRSYIESALQAILAVSQDGKIVFMNGHTEEIFGYTRAELFGNASAMLLPPRFHAAYTAALQSYFAAPSVRVLGTDMELAGLRKNGDEFPIEIGLSYVQAHDGVIAIGFVSDVTDRKRARDELAYANAELRRTNIELERFAHLASHDLQEPLRMITSYLDLLDRRYDGKLDAEAHEFIDFAVAGAKRMRALIDDLLRFSRAGTEDLHFDPVAGETILAHALENLKVSIEQSGASVTFDPLPEIVADPGLLTLVFQNLIGNAIKFRRNSGHDLPNDLRHDLPQDIRKNIRINDQPHVHISANHTGREWIFSVRDNGIGIEPQHAARVFRIFERLHSADQYPGSGVGLALAQRVVERHGGRIWLESEVGMGTTFFFSILARASVKAQAAGNP